MMSSTKTQPFLKEDVDRSCKCRSGVLIRSSQSVGGSATGQAGVPIDDGVHGLSRVSHTETGHRQGPHTDMF